MHPPLYFSSPRDSLSVVTLRFPFPPPCTAPSFRPPPIGSSPHVSGLPPPPPPSICLATPPLSPFPECFA